MMQKKEGFATGDLYIQTRIRLLSENSKRPAIIFNSTLKTASGSEFKKTGDFLIPQDIILMLKWVNLLYFPMLL